MMPETYIPPTYPDRGGHASAPLLEVSRLKMYFPLKSGSILKRTTGLTKAVDDVSFRVEKGETLALVGESGSGKSTLASCILGLQKPTFGQVVFQGKDLTRIKPSEMRLMRKDMQIIFQDPYGSLNPRMTAEQIIGEPLVVHKLASSRKELRERVEQLLLSVGLNPNAAMRRPREFSGGQRQRIAIARALAVNPSFIICDEPVSALDVSIQAQVVNLLEDVQEQLSLTYLFISHDLSLVRHIADRVAVMYRGHLVEIADRDELYANQLHPYTKALISAVPIPDPVQEAKRRPIVLGGDAVSAADEPKGCVFVSRCPLMVEECKAEMPKLREVKPMHWVACIRAGDIDAGEK